MPKYLWINNTLDTRRALSSRSGYLVRELYGFSLPGKDHISARAPQQHGATYVDTFFRPRECSMIIHVKGCNADDFQAKHRALVRAMNPLDDCELRIETDGGDRYTLTCRPVTAMEVERFNAITSDILVQLVADDPFFYGPREDYSEIAIAGSALLIPFTIPDVISSGSAYVEFEAQNDGHVLTYPILSLLNAGPVAVSNPTFTNVDTGESLTVNVDIEHFEQLFVDIGARTVTLQGVSVISEASGTFWSLPVGATTVRITAEGGALWGAGLSHHERYLAVV